MKQDRITVRLSSDLRRRLKSAAKRAGARESDLFRSAVERLVSQEDQQPSAYDRLKRAGLIGRVKGAPRDLSTNRKYFEGFGAS